MRDKPDLSTDSANICFCFQAGKNAVVGRKSILQKLNMSEFASSTKIEAVVKAIKSCQKKDSFAKAIIFSQYTTMIDLVEWRLKQEGIRMCKLVLKHYVMAV